MGNKLRIFAVRGIITAQTEAGGMGLSGIRKLTSQLVSSVRCGLEKFLAVQVWWLKSWKNQTWVRFKSDAKGGFLISGLPFASAGWWGMGGCFRKVTETQCSGFGARLRRSQEHGGCLWFSSCKNFRKRIVARLMVRDWVSPGGLGLWLFSEAELGQPHGESRLQFIVNKGLWTQGVSSAASTPTPDLTCRPHLARIEPLD